MFVKILVVLLVIQGIHSSSITTISPKSGSYLGETRLSILGEGFDIRGRSNDVFIGLESDGVFCDPVPNECHEKRIVCLTPANKIKGVKTISVRSFGQLASCKVASGCTFEFTGARTPVVTRIIPQYLAGEGVITVQGYRFSAGEPSVGKFDFTMHIGDEERCQVIDPITWNGFQCLVGKMTAGTLKLNIALGDTGKAAWDSTPLTLSIFPLLTGLRPNRGSMTGGQLVTLTGSGFSKELTNNRIKIHGSECIPVEYREEGLVCRTTAVKDVTKVGPYVNGNPWISGKLLYENFLFINGYDVFEDMVGTVNYLNPTQVKYVSSLSERETCDFCGSQWTTYFVPKETGNHTFYLLGDDQVSIWLSDSEAPVAYVNTAVVNTDPFNQYRIVHNPSWSSTFLFPPSAPIWLVAGKRYWMRLFMKEHGGGDGIDAEVVTPSNVRAKIAPSYVQYRDPYEPPVDIEVNGMKGQYDPSCLKPGACFYEYAEAATPYVSYAVPSTVSSGSNLKLVGNYFPESCNLVKITVGSSTCTPTSCGVTEIRCTVSQDTKSGNQSVTVSISGIGNAKGGIQVTVLPVIVTPQSKESGLNGGETLEVKGNGLSKDVEVIVGTKACSTKQSTLNSVACLIPKSNETVSTNASISVVTKTEVEDSVNEGIGFNGKVVRPGTTTDATPPTITPNQGSTLGGLVVTITSEELVESYEINSNLLVTLGDTKRNVSCTILVALPSLVKCTTGAFNYPGPVDVIIMYRPRSLAIWKRITLLSAFTYLFDVITGVSPQSSGRVVVSPYGGTTLTIAGLQILAARKPLNIQYCGKVLQSRLFQYNVLVSIPAIPTTVDQQTLDSFSELPALGRFVVSDNVVAQGNTVTIPASKEFFVSKRTFTRPISFEAKVTPTATNCITMHIFSSEHGIQFSGYHFTIIPSAKTLTYGNIDDYRTITMDSNAPTLGAGITTTWRVNVLLERIELFLNDVSIVSFFDTTLKSGSVGFAQSCQTISVSNMVVQSLQNRTVTIESPEGKVVFPRDVVPSELVVPRIISLSKNNVVGGEIITIMGVNVVLDTPSANSFLLSPSADSQEVNVAMAESLCIEIPRTIDLSIFGQGTGVECRINPGLPSGSRYVRMRNQYGLDNPSNALFVTISPVMISTFPTRCGANGAMITVTGGGFFNVSVDVTVGTVKCNITAVAPNKIVCQAPPMSNGQYNIVVNVSSNTLSCTSCKIQYLDTITPEIIELRQSSGVQGDLITIKGKNFTSDYRYLYVRFGTQPCWRWWQDGTYIACSLGKGLLGNSSLFVSNENGIAVVPVTIPVFANKQGIFRISPSLVGTTGGARLTVTGNGFDDDWQSSDSLIWNVQNTSTSQLEANTAGQVVYCEQFGLVYGAASFGAGSFIRKSFTVPSHTRVRVQAVLVGVDSWDANEDFLLLVDGVVVGKRNGENMPTNLACGVPTSWDYQTEFDVVLSHTSSTLNVSITTTLDQDPSDESWGISFLKVSYSTADTSTAVSVGGISCPILKLESGSIQCTLPSLTDGTHQVVVSNGGGALPCFGACSVEARSSKNVGVVGVTPIKTQIPKTEAIQWGGLDYMNVTAGDEDEGWTISKRLNAPSGWNAGAFSAQKFFKESNFDGISFQCFGANSYGLLGLTSTNNNAGLWELDYAIYCAGSTMVIFENGRQIAVMNTFKPTTVFSLMVNRSSNQMNYYRDGVIVYTSITPIRWPLLIDSSVYDPGHTFTNIKLVTNSKNINSFSIRFNDTVDRSTTSILLNNVSCEIFLQLTNITQCSTSDIVGNVSLGSSVNVSAATALATRTGLVSITPQILSVTPTTLRRNVSNYVTVQGVFPEGSVALSLTDSQSSSYALNTTRRNSSTIELYCSALSSGSYQLTVIVEGVSSSDSFSITVGDVAQPYYMNNVTLPARVSDVYNVTLLGNFPVGIPLIILSRGSYRIPLQSLSSNTTSVAFQVPPVEAGEYSIQVVYPTTSVNLIGGTALLTIQPQIISTSPGIIGTSGGAVLSIFGKGFSKLESGNMTLSTDQNVSICSIIQRLDINSFICVTNPGLSFNSMTLWVNSIPTTSTAITVSDTYSPVVSAISPPMGKRGDLLTIMGQRFGTPIQLSIGTAILDVVSASTTKVVARINGDTPLGLETTFNFTFDSGRAIVPSAVNFTFTFGVERITPAIVDLIGTNESSAITITGTGFGSNADCINVQIGLDKCEIDSIAPNLITCFPPILSIDDKRKAIKVSVNNLCDRQSLTYNLSTNVTYLSEKSASVNSFAPTFGSAAGGTLVTIQGQNFASKAEDNVVLIGKTVCVVTDVATTLDALTCRTESGSPSKSSLVNVFVKGIGRANNTNATSGTFDFNLNISSIEPAQGSVAGGTILTINGIGFSNAINTTTVRVGNFSCTVLSSTPTQIRCLTPATQRVFNDRYSSMLSTNLVPYPPMLVDVVVIVNKSVSDACANCFNYSVDYTPAVSAVNPKTNLNKGSVITITGTGFTAASTAYIGTEPCNVGTVTTTSIECTLNSTNVGKWQVRVSVPTKGDAWTTLTCPEGYFLSCDGTCFTDSDCQFDEFGIYTCRDVFRLIRGDTFCHSNGGSDRVMRPFTSNTGRILNFNCPMYDCEGQDCNTTLTIGGRGAVVSTCGQDPYGFFVEYRPLVTSVTPQTSSRAGGLNVTIVGSNFGTLASTIVVTGSSYCIPLEVSDTSIICSTQANTVDSTKLIVRNAGVLANCSGTICDFGFPESQTPVVDNLGGLTSYSSTTLSGFATPSNQLSLTGSFLTSDSALVIVMIGGQKRCSDVVLVNSSFATCTLPFMSAGRYAISVFVNGKGYAIFSATFNSAWSATPLSYQNIISSIYPLSGSTEGGTLVQVSSIGHSRTSVLQWGSITTAFDVVNVTETSMFLMSRPQSAANRTFTTVEASISSICTGVCYFAQSAAYTPVITSVSPVTASATASTSLTIVVNALSTSVSFTITVGSLPCNISTTTFSSNTATIVCDVSNAQPAGPSTVVVNVYPYGKAKSSPSIWTVQFPLSVTTPISLSGSLGGGHELVFQGTGFSSATTVVLGTIPCDVKAVSLTALTCVTRNTSAASTNNIVLTNNGVSTNGGTYTYSDSLTPTITSIAPSRGSTAGGTVVTLIGTNLQLTTLIKLGTSTCTLGQVTSTQLTCTTAFQGITTSAPVTVVTANGKALGAFVYEFIDLWSRRTTWGGQSLPEAGDSVVISEGQTVLLDMTPPQMYLIIVMGHLKADENTDLELRCTYIMVNFGRLTIGTPSSPFTKNFTFTLYGNRLTPEIPVHGAKVIALRNGAIDMHGIPRYPTWTRLATTANQLSATIVVRGAVDWKAGETIVISSTSFEMEEAEERNIVSVVVNADTTSTITFDSPLLFTHYGEIQCFQDACVDESAAVGLLTRNIVIQGDEDSIRYGFGGTMFLMPLGQSSDRYARLSFVEFRDVGQQYIVGRYPVHFHVTYEASNSYVNGTSVHRSLNRAFSIHGVSYNTYVNNVAYDIQGHAFFIEDGSERFNVIRNNLVMVVHSSTSNLNTDLTPACFWIVSPQNYVTDNRAAGAASYGFWISPFDPTATGPSGSSSICPVHHTLLAFDRNVGNSNGKYGINIFRYWFPKAIECNSNSADVQAVLRNNTVYKNKIHGVTMGNSDSGVVGAVVFDGLVSADNGFQHADASAVWVEKISSANMTTGIRNSILIALTNNQPYVRTTPRRGITLPQNDNWFSENITFVNYENENSGMEPNVWAHRMSICFPYGWEAVSRGLRWINSPNRIRFRFQHLGILNDDDGTLAGLAKSQVVPQASMFDPSICVSVENTGFPAMRCPYSYKIRRLGLSTVNEIYKDQKWTVNGRVEIIPVVDRTYHFTVPVNSFVTIDFQHWYNPKVWDYRWGSSRFNVNNEKLILTTSYANPLHHIYVTTTDGVQKTNALYYPALSNTTYSQRYDNNTGLFGTMLKFPTPQVTVESFDCPETGCPLSDLDTTPARRTPTSWQLTSSWSTGKIPVPNDEVVIQQPDSISLTGPGTYNFNSLKIKGQLYLSCTAGNDLVLNINKWVWINGGILDIGSSSNPVAFCKITINLGKALYTLQDSQARQLLPWGIRTFAMEYGEINVYGSVPDRSRTTLAQTAPANSKTLILNDAVTWTAGQYIVVASTQRDEMWTKTVPSSSTEKGRVEQSEKVVIQSVSSDGKVITLSNPLTYSHYGSLPYSLKGGTFFPGAEVVLLDRNVIFGGSQTENETPYLGVGWQFTVGCTTENYDGCVKPLVSGGNGWPMSIQKTGLVNIRGVQFRNIGQSAKKYGGINVDGLWTANGDAQGSSITGCTIVGSTATAILIPRTTKNFLVDNNIIYGVGGDGIMVRGSGNVITNNVVIAVQQPDPQCISVYDPEVWDCRVATFRIRRGNVVVGNIAASGAGIGFLTDGEWCEAPSLWKDNIVHSHRDGVLIADTPVLKNLPWGATSDATVNSDSCRLVTGIASYWNSDHGFVTWFMIGNLKVRDYVSVDNMIGFTSVQMYTDEYEANPFVDVRNSTFMGKWNASDACRGLKRVCRTTVMDMTAAWCTFWYSLPVHATFQDIGIQQSSFVTDLVGIGMGEKKMLWDEVDAYPTMKGVARFTDILFDNFDGQDACGKKNVAVSGSVWSNDTFVPHVFSQVTWGSNMRNNGEVGTRTMYGFAPTEPGHSQARFLDYDYPKLGGLWPDSPNKFFIADSDGTFSQTGVTSSIVNSLSLVSTKTFASIAYDGKAFDSRAPFADTRPECTYKSSWNAFLCQSVKYVTIAIDSLADDRMTRRPGPVVVCKGDGVFDSNTGWPICEGGYVDLASGSVPHQKAHRATEERPSRYFFLVEANSSLTLSFRGQPPTWMRLWLLNHEYIGTNAGVTVKLRYFGLNSASRVGVFVNKTKLPPKFGYGAAESQRPSLEAPNPSSTGGTHYHDKTTNVFGVTLRPYSPVDLKQEPIIQVTMSVAMTEDDFFNNKNTFAIALANLLGISSSRIRFASIVAGSTLHHSRQLMATGVKVKVEIDSEAASQTTLAPSSPSSSSSSSSPSGSTSTSTSTVDTSSSLELSSVSTKLASVTVNPQVITAATASLGVAIPVSSMTASLVSVVVPRPTISIANGVPYLDCNVTTSTTFSSSSMQSAVSSWLRSLYPSTAPFMTASMSDVSIGAVYYDSTTTKTSFVILLTYESATDIILGINKIGTTPVGSLAFPSGYTVVDFVLQMNGAALPTAPPTGTPAPPVVITPAPPLPTYVLTAKPATLAPETPVPAIFAGTPAPLFVPSPPVATPPAPKPVETTTPNSTLAVTAGHSSNATSAPLTNPPSTPTNNTATSVSTPVSTTPIVSTTPKPNATNTSTPVPSKTGTPSPTSIFDNTASKSVIPVVRIPTTLTSLSQVNTTQFKIDLMQRIAVFIPILNESNASTVVKLITCEVDRSLFPATSSFGTSVCGTSKKCDGTNTLCPTGIIRCECGDAVTHRHRNKAMKTSSNTEVQMEATFNLQSTNYVPASVDELTSVYKNLTVVVTNIMKNDTEFAQKFGVDAQRVSTTNAGSITPATYSPRATAVLNSSSSSGSVSSGSSDDVDWIGVIVGCSVVGVIVLVIAAGLIYYYRTKHYTQYMVQEQVKNAGL